MGYTYIKKDRSYKKVSEILLHYNIDGITRQPNVDRIRFKHELVESLDVWNLSNADINEKVMKLTNYEILYSLRSFILMHGENQLQSTTNPSQDIERYFSVCEKWKLTRLYDYQIPIFNLTSTILLENRVESPHLYEKLFELMKNNYLIQNNVMNDLDPQHLGYFLKQSRLAGCRINSAVFPLQLIDLDSSVDQLHVLLQYIPSLKTNIGGLSMYIFQTYFKILPHVIPKNYSIERFALMHLVFEFAFTQNTEDFISAMMLVFRSVSHAYFTITEVDTILERLTSNPDHQRLVSERCRIFNRRFIFPNSRPRSLKHYARTSFRNSFVIPDKIDNSNSADSIISYLKLFDS